MPGTVSPVVMALLRGHGRLLSLAAGRGLTQLGRRRLPLVPMVAHATGAGRGSAAHSGTSAAAVI